MSDKKGTSQRNISRELAVAIFLAILIRSTFIQAYHIPSGSMEDTLLVGDYFIGDKLTFGTQIPDRLPVLNTKLPSLRVPGFSDPAPGDVVVFEFPQDSSRDMIKRCVAVAGQTVEIKNKILFVDGKRFENPPGVKHEDSHIYKKQEWSRDNFGPYRVPAEHIFVMGDNRDNSDDSRFWGPVPLTKMKARPRFIYFSWDNSVSTWNLFAKIRWSRLGFVN